MANVAGIEMLWPAFAREYPWLPYVPIQPPLVPVLDVPRSAFTQVAAPVVGGATGGGAPLPPKKMPETTQFGPLIGVTIIVTCPETVQIRYVPFTKFETVCGEVKGLPEAASRIETDSDLPWLSQSRR